MESSENNAFKIQNCLEHTFRREIEKDVHNGMVSARKSLPSKYFYDARGSKIFDDICHLPEYYPTRTELSILRNSVSGIMATFHEGDLVELGPGAHLKIQILLDALARSRRKLTRYIPIDVSRSALINSARELSDLYPEVEVFAVVADFMQPLNVMPDDRMKLIIIFGGTIGNLDEEESIGFLRSVAGTMKMDDRFLFGLDMIKSRDILESAYNDSQGITAEFNRNILSVINRELNANFDPSLFKHVAFFNEERDRVEMHLQARKDMAVEINDLDLPVTLKKGEMIRTEICRKFSRESAEKMLSASGLEVSEWFTDAKEWFSLVEAKIKVNPG
jgi:L-histidine N-alpha-methyltransferase